MNEAVSEAASSINGVASDRAVRWSVAALLVVTALLKAYSQRETVLMEAAYEVPGWLVIAVVQMELLLAVALTTRLFARATRPFAIAIFTCFAAFSLYRALRGHESCGCFGALQVNAWWTFALDLVVLAVLATWQPEASPQRDPWRPAFAATTYGVLAVSTLVPSFADSRLRGENALVQASGLTIVEPDGWVGNAFPLAPFLDPPVDLSHRDWIVVFYHHDCPECQAAKPKYEELAHEPSPTADGRQVLIVEVPPYGVDDQSESTHAIHSRLSDEREWFVQAPVEIGVKDGQVTYASLKLPSIHSEPSAE